MDDSRAPGPSRPLDRLGIFAGVAAGLVGCLVAIACIAVPLLHFVLGPLGPAIGGLVAGRLGGSSIRRMLVIALTMAVGMALVAAALTGALLGNEVDSGWARFAPAIVFVYTGGLAAVGTFFGAAMTPAD